MRSRSSRRSLLVALGLFAVTLLAAPALRADDEKKTGGDGEWQSVQTQMVQPGESFEAKNLVAVAYGFIWVMVAGFVFTVWRRADRLEKEIEALRAQVKEKGRGGPGAAR